MKKKLIFITIILNSFFSFCQNDSVKIEYRKEIQELVNVFINQEEICISNPAEIFDMPDYKHISCTSYETLKKIATNDELKTLCYHNNSKVRVIAFYALTERNNNDLFQIIYDNILNDNVISYIRLPNHPVDRMSISNLFFRKMDYSKTTVNQYNALKERVITSNINGTYARFDAIMQNIYDIMNKALLDSVPFPNFYDSLLIEVLDYDICYENNILSDFYLKRAPEFLADTVYKSLLSQDWNIQNVDTSVNMDKDYYIKELRLIEQLNKSYYIELFNRDIDYWRIAMFGNESLYFFLKYYRCNIYPEFKDKIFNRFIEFIDEDLGTQSVTEYKDFFYLIDCLVGYNDKKLNKKIKESIELYSKKHSWEEPCKDVLKKYLDKKI